MLTPDMRRLIAEQRLGFAATASLDGTPYVSPKVPSPYWTIRLSHRRDPLTRNLEVNPRIEVNFVDPFAS